MRHGKKLKKLNRKPSHRKSLLMNLAISLFKHERIRTTLTKAKVLRPFAERLITKSRNDNLHTFRQLSSKISDKSVVKKLVRDIGERFKKRPGGYTRIYKCGFRTNDGAPLALIELVDYSGKETRSIQELKKVSYNKVSQGTKDNKTSLSSDKKIKDVKDLSKETKSSD